MDNLNMLDKSGLENLAKTIPIDYGDTITKKDLIDAFEIDQSYKHRDSIALADYESASESAAWEFLSCMDIFRVYLRELRSMHLEALGRRNTYRVIRPDQHVAVALGHLRKSIEKGFSKAHAILDATAEDLLEASDKSRYRMHK